MFLLLPTVFEKVAHAGESYRGGEASHQTFLPEEGHQQGRIQRDSPKSRPEGDLKHFIKMLKGL